MAEGSEVFSFKTMMNCRLLPKVEEMCLQHLSTFSLKRNEPDGLHIDENLAKSKRRFLALRNELHGAV